MIATAAGGFVTACRCGLRRWYSNRETAQREGEKHGWVCRWWKG